MHTKLKGDIGELIVATELLRTGWHVAFPYGENLKYDIVAEKEGVFKRIQVKAVTPQNGVLRVNCRASNNWSVLHYTPKDFEMLAVADLTNRKVYFIPSGRMTRNLINLRISPPKNGQKRKVNLAEDFTKIDSK